MQSEDLEEVHIDNKMDKNVDTSPTIRRKEAAMQRPEAISRNT